jgi:hemerythrin
MYNSFQMKHFKFIDTLLNQIQWKYLLNHTKSFQFTIKRYKRLLYKWNLPIITKLLEVTIQDLSPIQ